MHQFKSLGLKQNQVQNYVLFHCILVVYRPEKTSKGEHFPLHGIKFKLPIAKFSALFFDIK